MPYGRILVDRENFIQLFDEFSKRFGVKYAHRSTELSADWLLWACSALNVKGQARASDPDGKALGVHLWQTSQRPAKTFSGGRSSSGVRDNTLGKTRKRTKWFGRTRPGARGLLCVTDENQASKDVISDRFTRNALWYLLWFRG